MRIDTLHKLLTTYPPFSVADGLALKKELFSSECPVVGSWPAHEKWHDEPPSQEDVVTYEKCHRFEVEPMANQTVLVHMTIYEGDFHGMPTSERCKFCFALQSVGPVLEGHIGRWLDRLAERRIEREDEELLKQRIAEAREIILLEAGE